MTPKRISIILTTYNQPEWLGKVLRGYEVQTFKGFEVILADDGSGPETRALADAFRGRGPLAIRHVWQPHDGFRKCRILNQAIMASETDYLLFSDGDCVPRNDFVEVHVRNARRGRFLSGGYVKLTTPASEAITEEDVRAQRPFDVAWLRRHGQPWSLKLAKLTRSRPLARVLNALTTTGATWNGHNASTWKEDLVRVNGYNEDMPYGGLDRELGERLVNAGVKGLQIRYSAVCVHLDHPRPYKDPEILARNRAVREAVRRDHVTRTPNGIVKDLPLTGPDA
ncbi:MAG: glycosyltransferase family 2 protein [Phycisphaerae bacterium]|nr:glycosyltransferase family 2 protein [Phycisphaerae bacterium]